MRSLCAALLATACSSGALQVIHGLFDASTFFELRRTPELFCGFPRRAGEGPTLYPVACSPQSWAAGAVFFMLQACLGLSINATKRQICFTRPVLPDSVSCVTIKNLCVNDAVADLVLDRYAHDVGISVTAQGRERRDYRDQVAISPSPAGGRLPASVDVAARSTGENSGCFHDPLLC